MNNKSLDQKTHYDNVTIRFLTFLLDELVVFFDTTAPMTLPSSDNKFKSELPSDDDDDEEAEE